MLLQCNMEPRAETDHEDISGVDQGETPPDCLLDLIVSSPLEEFPFEEFLNKSYSEDVWDAVADVAEDKATLPREAISPAREARRRKRKVEKNAPETAPRPKRNRAALQSSTAPPGFNLAVQEGDFQLTGASSILRFPLALATAASFMTSGAPAMQVIHAFNPGSAPVLKGILPAGHTYVLVSPPCLEPLPQTAPLSPLDGTVAPLELSAYVQPASSLSDGAGRTLPRPVPVSPVKDKSQLPPATQRVEATARIPHNVHVFIERLKSHLRERCSGMGGGMCMETHYVDAALVQRQLVIRTGKNANKCLEKELVMLSDSERQKATTHRRNLFHSTKRLIALLGGAGAGKSTLIRRLALDWSAGDLQQFQLIFLLDCRFLDLTASGFSLKRLLLDSSASPRCEDSDAVFKHLLTFPENVLIVFDSFDDTKDLEGLLQCPATSAAEGSYTVRQLFSGLFQKKILPGCTLLIASRPKDALNQLLRKVDSIVELCCFSPEDVETYVGNYFADAAERAEALRKIRSQKFMFSVCSNPSLCRLICFLTRCQRGSGLPSTLTELYSRALGLYLEMDNDLQGSKPDVVALCNAAWGGFKTQTSILNQKQNGNLIDSGVRSGILLTHAPYDAPTDNRVFYFADLYMQGFLSALLLVHSNEHNEKAMLSHTALQRRKRKAPRERHSVLQRFVMGLLFQNNAPPCLRVLQRHIDLQAKRRAVKGHLEALRVAEPIPGQLLELCHCVHEAGNLKLAKLLVRNLPDALPFCGTRLLPPDIHVLSRLLLQTRGLRRSFSLDLRDTCISLSGLADLVALDVVATFRAPTMDTIRLWEALHRRSDKAGLKSAVDKFTINPLKVSRRNDVENLLVLVRIHNQKKLPSCEAEAALEDGVPALRRLHKLEYELGQHHSPETFLHLVQILPSLQSLQHLDLENNKMGNVEAAQLADVLRSLSSLKLLNLSQNCIGDGGVQRLSEVLMHTSSLQSLSLYGNVIGDDGAESLATVLPRMTSLLDLDVKYNKFTDVGAKRLGAALKDSPSVKSLQMWNACIPYGVLEHLQIQDCRIKPL